MNGNGVYTAVKTNDGVKTVFIEEEVMELDRLNRVVDQRRSEGDRRSEEADMARKEHNLRLAKDEERRKRVTIRLIRQELKVLAAIVIICLSLDSGLVAASFAIPVLIGFQAIICFRVGRYFGKYPMR